MSAAVRRLAGNPIVSRETSATLGANINGPSLVAAPPWLRQPLGRYYLYFAHHRGTYIRLATADSLEGPWAVYEPGTLQLARSHFPTAGQRPHIASPDVHVDHAARTVRMYYHGLLDSRGRQFTRVALSHDGLAFEARPELLGRPYFRAFAHGGWWYALGKPGVLARSPDGLGGFEDGPRLLGPAMRHSATLVRGDSLFLFWSEIGDCPERILWARVRMGPDWRAWRAGPARVLLEPERSWEGVDRPLLPSRRAWSDEPVRQLRDPAVFEEGGSTYLLYAVAGESGIAIAELSPDVLEAEADRDSGDRRAGRPAVDGGAERRAPPPDRAWLAAERVLAYLSRTHRRSYRLVERLSGRGPVDAYLVQASDGSNAVLRWSHDRSRADEAAQAAGIVAAARSWGWPTPAWLEAGLTPSGFPYHTEAVAEGGRPATVDEALARAVLRVVDSQAGRAPQGGRDWAAWDRQAVLAAEGRARGVVASHSPAGRDLVRDLLAWCAPYGDAPIPGGDLVHGDLGRSSVRVSNGRLSALVGVDGAGHGTRLHDVATLLCALRAPEESRARAALVAYGRERAVPGAWEVSLAAALLGALAEAIEDEPATVGERLRTARDLMRMAARPPP